MEIMANWKTAISGTLFLPEVTCQSQEHEQEKELGETFWSASWLSWLDFDCFLSFLLGLLLAYVNMTFSFLAPDLAGFSQEGLWRHIDSSVRCDMKEIIK